MLRMVILYLDIGSQDVNNFKVLPTFQSEQYGTKISLMVQDVAIRNNPAVCKKRREKFCGQFNSRGQYSIF